MNVIYSVLYELGMGLYGMVCVCVSDCNGIQCFCNINSGSIGLR